MKKKTLAIALSLAMTASLAACGGEKPADTEKEPEQKTEAEGETKEDETKEEEPEAAAPTEISVVTTYAGNDTNSQNYKDAVAAWEAETGNTVNDASATSDETFKAKVATDFEVGSEPDVLFFFNGMDSNSFVEAGKVVSVDDIRAEFPEYATNMKDDMLGASPVDGKNYSVPVNGYWEGMFVNKKVLEAAGAEMPGADTTWDQFLETCQKIKDAGYAPIAASLATIPHYWFEFCIYNQGSAKTHNALPAEKGDEQAKRWVAGLEDIKELYEKGFFPDNTLSGTDDETFQMFMDGKAAFLVDGSWKAGGIKEAAANLDDFTVTYIPGKGDRKATDIIGGLSSGYFITKKAWDDPAKKAAAVSFVEFMTSDENVAKFAGTSATALKEKVQVDESTLTQLDKDALEMLAGTTGIAGAVQDQIPAECRVPVFDGMPNLVTGKADIAESVDEVLDLIANYVPKAE